MMSEALPLIGLLFGVLVVGPLLCWAVGMFNPMGYLGVPPWRVPRCTCGRELAHESNCPRRIRMPRS